MSLTANAQAVLLLTARLGGQTPDSGNKPLTVTEWAKVAKWLKALKSSPGALLGDADLQGEVVQALNDVSIGAHRLQFLLGRGVALAVSLERWERAGLWVMIRSDDDYPKRLKRRLGWRSPPLFFGCGSRALLGRGGIAVVGSRNASQQSLDYAAGLAACAATKNRTIISGGAKGVDQAAMLGSLRNNGNSVGVLANDLLRESSSGKYRAAIREGRLTLISPFNPESRFNTGNAMARNDYIYGLADQAVIVCSDAGSGGTWAGALSNLKNGWVPQWVRRGEDAGAGNASLLGSKALNGHPDGFDELFPKNDQSSYRQVRERITAARKASRPDRSNRRKRASGSSAPHRRTRRSAQPRQGPLRGDLRQVDSLTVAQDKDDTAQADFGF